MTVLVTGATGQVGRLLVEELLRSGAAVRALSRTPEQASLPSEADVIAGDFADPSSLDLALDGVDTVFLVWAAPVDTAAAVIERIATQPSGRPRRIVYLSAPIWTPHPFFQQPNPLRELHVAVERILKAKASTPVIVRPGIFASNALHWWAPQIRAGDVVRWPVGAAETAPVDERDIAAVAARALIDDRHAGADVVLTGPESLSQAEQVRIIGNVIGRSIRFEELTPKQFRLEAEATWPPGVADMLLTAWLATSGVPAFVTTSIEEITGSPPRTFRQWTLDNSSAFTAPG